MVGVLFKFPTSNMDKMDKEEKDYQNRNMLGVLILKIGIC